MAKGNDTGTCMLNGCDKRSRSKIRSYCEMHYRRFKLHGDPGPAHMLNSPLLSECVIEGCAAKPIAKNLCNMHYQRVKLGIPMRQPKRRRWLNDVCRVDGCERPRSLKAGEGMCAGHYQRHLTGREIQGPLRVYASADPDDPDTWNPSRSSSGYIVLTYNRNGIRRQIPEHRWVMQKSLGRELFEEEDVHHINGVRDDNRIENLELWSYSHPRGQRVQDKVEWARSILKLYGTS